MSPEFPSFRKQGKSPLTSETTAQLIRFLRSYFVYNADEIDGLPAWYYPRPVAPTLNSGDPKL